MGLVIKSSMEAFWNTKDWSPEPHQLLEQFKLERQVTDVPLFAWLSRKWNDRRKLMKVQELQSCAKNIGKITQVKKKLKPQVKH